jgi:hypothetical protein
LISEQTPSSSKTMRRNIPTVLLLVAGLLMTFAAYVHAAIVVPHLREDMLEIEVRPTLLNATILAMHFGTFAMIAFAGVVLWAAIQSYRRVLLPRIPLAIIALTYIAFGIFAFVATKSHHTLGYVLMGLLTGVATATTTTE